MCAFSGLVFKNQIFWLWVSLPIKKRPGKKPVLLGRGSLLGGGSLPGLALASGELLGLVGLDLGNVRLGERGAADLKKKKKKKTKKTSAGKKNNNIRCVASTRTRSACGECGHQEENVTWRGGRRGGGADNPAGKSQNNVAVVFPAQTSRRRQ